MTKGLECNKENMVKVIRLAKSGEINQAFGILQAPNGCMCFEGVACEAFRRDTGKGEWVTGVFVLGKAEFESSMPQTVEEDWLGIDSSIGLVGVNPKRKRHEVYRPTVTRLNDTYQLSLSEIADCVAAAYGLDLSELP